MSGLATITSAEVIFSRKVLSGNGENERIDDVDGIKISRGEENIFVWCFFLMQSFELASSTGHEAYKWVKHVYIDDPISSLDEQQCHRYVVRFVGTSPSMPLLAQDLNGQRNPINTVVSTHHARVILQRAVLRAAEPSEKIKRSLILSSTS